MRQSMGRVGQNNNSRYVHKDQSNVNSATNASKPSVMNTPINKELAKDKIRDRATRRRTGEHKPSKKEIDN